MGRTIGRGDRPRARSAGVAKKKGALETYRPGIRCTKLIGLNYEPLFNCTPDVCPINKLASREEEEEQGEESNDALLNGIINPRGSEEGGCVSPRN